MNLEQYNDGQDVDIYNPPLREPHISFLRKRKESPIEK